MIDYNKLVKGDEVIVVLAQEYPHKWAGVVTRPVQWKSKKQVVGLIWCQVAFHADLERCLVIHSKIGTTKRFDRFDELFAKEAA